MRGEQHEVNKLIPIRTIQIFLKAPERSEFFKKIVQGVPLHFKIPDL